MASDKKIEDYLHLYLGCEMVSKSTGEKMGKLLGIVGNEAHFKINGIMYSSHLFNYKPILRPLSDMSEEEACALEWYMWEEIPDACFGDRDEILKMFVNSEDKYRPGFEPMVLAINWLRKNSFDVDGLIDAGIALDKNSLK